MNFQTLIAVLATSVAFVNALPGGGFGGGFPGGCHPPCPSNLLCGPNNQCIAICFPDCAPNQVCSTKTNTCVPK
ncbi:hypothetical protein BCR33DRAFT_726706, partial [Rhizoclosmatium globosum]